MFTLREKFTAKKLLTIVLGFSGVLLIITKGDFSQIHLKNYLVDVLVLLAAFSAALFSVLSKKVQFEPCTMVSVFYLTATVASFISMILLSDFALPKKETIVLILVNGIFINGYSYILWIKALKISDAYFVTPFVF